MDLHWGFHQESHRNPGSSAAAAAAAVAVAAIVLGLGVGSAVARVAAHTAVSQAEARNVVVGWYCRQEEAGSVVVGVREEMWVVEGRTGRLAEARSTAVATVGLVFVRRLFRSVP
jgi:hypothetical protein